MSEAKQAKGGIMDALVGCLPSCHKAIDLVETGIERPLTFSEKLSLKYNSTLCPFCSCAAERIRMKKAQMAEAEANR